MAVPFFHVTGCGAVIKSFSDGIPMVLMRRWNVDEAIDLMVRYKVTTMTCVPAIIIAIMQSPRLPKDFAMQGLAYGGAPAPDRMPQDIKNRWPDAGM
jgi:acyl-CoA synthetase (AMP-forming)/AMP-acid ligase II